MGEEKGRRKTLDKEDNIVDCPVSAPTRTRAGKKKGLKITAGERRGRGRGEGKKPVLPVLKRTPPNIPGKSPGLDLDWDVARKEKYLSSLPKGNSSLVLLRGGNVATGRGNGTKRGGHYALREHSQLSAKGERLVPPRKRKQAKRGGSQKH